MDRRLQRLDLCVYSAMWREFLDTHEWRAVKLSWVAKIAGMKPAKASPALRRLVTFGYLVRRDAPCDAAAKYEYRIPLTIPYRGTTERPAA